MDDHATLQDLIHRRHELGRRQLLATLHAHADADRDWIDLETPHPARKLAGRLAACCRSPRVMQDNATGQVIYVPSRCNSRVCPLCAPLRAAELQACVKDAAAKIDSPRLLTLTLRSTPEPLADQLTRLRACFRTLRRTKPWRQIVRGGIAVVEVTYNPRDDTWHPHLHVLIDATYWPQADIADLWESITKDSRIVDIRMVHSREAAIRYVSKYVAKSSEIDNLPDRRITEKAIAFSGLRVAQTFGHLHGTRTKKGKTARPEGISDVIGLEQLWRASKDGDVRARRLMRAIKLATAEPVASRLNRHKTLIDKVRAWSSPADPAAHVRPPPTKTECLWKEEALIGIVDA